MLGASVYRYVLVINYTLGLTGEAWLKELKADIIRFKGN
jgi:hypothetical protein